MSAKKTAPAAETPPPETDPEDAPEADPEDVPEAETETEYGICGRCGKVVTDEVAESCTHPKCPQFITVEE